MSGNLFGEFAGVTDASRVRKPPGGDTNNIFGLETRQKWQASQEYSNNEIETSQKGDEGSNFMQAQDVGATDEFRTQVPTGGNPRNVSYFDMDKTQENQHGNQQMQQESYLKFPYVSQVFVQEGGHKLRNIEHDIPSAGGRDYAGVTDKTRVRKPPGGDTHDIFDMESRQRSQAMEKQMHLSTSFMNMNMCSQAGIGSLNIKDQLKGGQLSSDQFDQLLLQVDKENLNLLSEEDLAKEEILKQKSLDYNEDSNLPTTKKHFIRNPITGEVSEMKVSTCSKLVDCSNVTSSPRFAKKPDGNRTSVRVRQPPGGVSSHIF